MRKSYLQVVKQINKFALAFSGICTMNYLSTLLYQVQVIQKKHEAISSATCVDRINLFENSKGKTTVLSYLYRRYEKTAKIEDCLCNPLIINNVIALIEKWPSYASLKIRYLKLQFK